MTRVPTAPYALLMEDNPLDVFLLQEALQQAGITIELRVAQNGVEGLDMLETASQEGRLPKLIILDYNMPMLNGAEVLSRIRQHAQWANLKVIMLTTSRAHELQVRALQADDYLIKPDNIAAAQIIALKLGSYWH